MHGPLPIYSKIILLICFTLFLGKIAVSLRAVCSNPIYNQKIAFIRVIDELNRGIIRIKYRHYFNLVFLASVD